MTQIIGITGNPGAGKTLLAAYVAYREYQRGRQIRSNVRFAFPFQPLEFPKAKRGQDVPWEEVQDVLMVLDEAHVWLDSRMSATAHNRVVSWFLTQTRKRGVDLIYTTQFFHQVDKRLRNLTTAVIQCERRGDYVRGNVLCPPIPGVKPRRIMVYMPPCFDLYDTRQIILPG